MFRDGQVSRTQDGQERPRAQDAQGRTSLRETHPQFELQDRFTPRRRAVRLLSVHGLVVPYVYGDDFLFVEQKLEGDPVG